MMIFFPSFLPRPVRQFSCVLLRKIGVLRSFPRAEKLRLREPTARAWITAATAQARIELLQALGPAAQAQLVAASAALTAGRGSAAAEQLLCRLHG